jgi:hypothetical protein
MISETVKVKLESYMISQGTKVPDVRHRSSPLAGQLEPLRLEALNPTRPTVTDSESELVGYHYQCAFTEFRVRVTLARSALQVAWSRCASVKTVLLLRRPGLGLRLGVTVGVRHHLQPVAQRWSVNSFKPPNLDAKELTSVTASMALPGQPDRDARPGPGLSSAAPASGPGPPRPGPGVTQPVPTTKARSQQVIYTLPVPDLASRSQFGMSPGPRPAITALSEQVLGPARSADPECFRARCGLS